MTSPDNWINQISISRHYEVDRLEQDETFTAFSTHPYPSFPLAIITEREWVGRTNSHFAIPAFVQWREMGIEPDPDVLNFARNEVLELIAGNRPSLVIVDRRSRRHAIFERDFDFVEFYREDMKFRDVWEENIKTRSIDGFNIYIN